MNYSLSRTLYRSIRAINSLLQAPNSPQYYGVVVNVLKCMVFFFQFSKGTNSSF